jgi:hypothetical protein
MSTKELRPPTFEERYGTSNAMRGGMRNKQQAPKTADMARQTPQKTRRLSTRFRRIVLIVFAYIALVDSWVGGIAGAIGNRDPADPSVLVFMVLITAIVLIIAWAIPRWTAVAVAVSCLGIAKFAVPFTVSFIKAYQQARGG